MSGTLEDTYDGDYEYDYEDPPDSYDEDDYPDEEPKLKYGVVYQCHDSSNYAFDNNEFWRQQSYAEKHMERNEPGDMRTRGVWMTDGDFMYNPYAQLSCAYGQCIVNRADHLDRALGLAKKHGRAFIFTVVNKSLLEQALQKPGIIPLMTTESWMMDHNSVVLFAATNNGERL